MFTKETSILVAIIIAVCILVCILGGFIAGIIRYQRMHLQKQREQVHADMILLEAERSRLSADLHDNFGMMISSIKMALHCVEGTTEEQQRYLSHAEELIDILMQQIREVSGGLVPLTLQAWGTYAAIRELVEKIPLQGGPEVSVVLEGAEPGKESGVHIYRVVQELCNNTIKHARARRIVLQAEVRQKQWRLSYSDDGAGFDRRKAGDGRLGLQTIKRRVELLGGEVFLDTAPGKGCRYFINIPIQDYVCRNDTNHHC